MDFRHRRQLEKEFEFNNYRSLEEKQNIKNRAKEFYDKALEYDNDVKHYSLISGIERKVKDLDKDIQANEDAANDVKDDIKTLQESIRCNGEYIENILNSSCMDEEMLIEQQALIDELRDMNDKYTKDIDIHYRTIEILEEKAKSKTQEMFKAHKELKKDLKVNKIMKKLDKFRGFF